VGVGYPGPAIAGGWPALQRRLRDVRLRGCGQDAEAPIALTCPLVPYDPCFELGRALAETSRAVQLNHPYCASFCVLGGAACSR
jgi:hypothetical protein